MPPKSKLAGMTARRRAFVLHFVDCRNGAEAARKAGYSTDTAKEIAYALLRRHEIKAAIRVREEIEELSLGSHRSEVLNKLRDLVDRAMQAEPVRDKDGKKKGVYKFDGAVAVRALELLGKHEGLFRESLDVRVRQSVEHVLEGVRPFMSKEGYAELVRAVAEVVGVTGVGARTAEGDRSDSVH